MKQMILKSSMLCMIMSAAIFSNAQKVNFKLNPADGSSYTVSTVSKTNMTQNVMGQEMTISSTYNTTNIYSIKNNGSNKDITNTYKKFEMISNVNGQEIKLSSDDDNSQSKVLKSIVDKSYTATISENGEIIAVSGFEDLNNIASKEETLKQLVSKEALETAMKSSFGYIPGKEVSIGDTWVRNTVLKNMVSINQKTVYKLAAVNGNIATINFDAAVSTDGDKSFETQGMTMDMNITGTVKGSLQVNINDGMPTSATALTDMKGVVKVQGMEVPLEIKTDVTQKTTKN